MQEACTVSLRNACVGLCHVWLQRPLRPYAQHYMMQCARNVLILQCRSIHLSALRLQA